MSTWRMSTMLTDESYAHFNSLLYFVRLIYARLIQCILYNYNVFEMEIGSCKAGIDI